MSVGISWEPVPKKRRQLKQCGAPGQLATALRGRGSDASNILLGTPEEIAFLSGLATAGLEGAKELLEAVQEHGTIRIHFEY